MALRRLRDCDFSERVLYTAFLLLMGVGYLMALTYLYASHQGHDGEPGLSVHDVAETYYGNRSGTQLESAIRGSMSAHISIEDRAIIVEWLKSGALEPEYQRVVKPVFQRQCMLCHAAEPAKQFGGIPTLDTYAGVLQVADIDTGLSVMTLVKLSHIHLFGIGLILLGLGSIFCRV